MAHKYFLHTKFTKKLLSSFALTYKNKWKSQSPYTTAIIPYTQFTVTSLLQTCSAVGKFIKPSVIPAVDALAVAGVYSQIVGVWVLKIPTFHQTLNIFTLSYWEKKIIPPSWHTFTFAVVSFRQLATDRKKEFQIFKFLRNNDSDFVHDFVIWLLIYHFNFVRSQWVNKHLTDTLREVHKIYDSPSSNCNQISV